MARTVLTDSQKDQCFNDDSFRQEVKWGILNKAAFWKGLDGTSLPGGSTAANLARWAKSRALATVLTNSPSSADTDDNVRQFLIFIKTIPVWDVAGANSIADTVAYMVTNSTFDTLADNWFDNKIATSPF